LRGAAVGRDDTGGDAGRCCGAEQPPGRWYLAAVDHHVVLEHLLRQVERALGADYLVVVVLVDNDRVDLADAAIDRANGKGVIGTGGVDAEQRYTPGTGVRYGLAQATGRVKSCEKIIAPPVMSPPTRFALCCSSAAGLITLRAKMQSRKPGANRSI